MSPTFGTPKSTSRTKMTKQKYATARVKKIEKQKKWVTEWREKKYSHKFRNLIDYWHKHIDEVRRDTIDFKVNAYIKSLLLQFQIMWNDAHKINGKTIIIAKANNYTKNSSTQTLIQYINSRGGQTQRNDKTNNINWLFV